MTHVHQMINIAIMIVQIEKIIEQIQKFYKVSSSGFFFYFMTFSQNVQKNNEEEETECEVVRFDHVYQKNDDTDFRIEMPISFASL